MRKSLLVLLVAMVSFSLHAQVAPPPACEVLKEAYLQAARENKNVFVMFQASWCGWCKRMAKSIEDPACKKFFEDNYVIRYLVVDESPEKKMLEHPGAAALKSKYYGEGNGIPYWLVFDKDGNLLADCKIRKEGEGPEQGENSGCPATEKEVQHLLSVLKTTSPLPVEALEVIRKRFRENDK